MNLKLNSLFDSWRANVQPGLWLPCQIYLQETNLTNFFGGHERFKANTKLWNYQSSASQKESDFTSMTIESPVEVVDDSDSHDKSPVEAKRDWNNEAEANVNEGMERAGIRLHGATSTQSSTR